MSALRLGMFAVVLAICGFRVLGFQFLVSGLFRTEVSGKVVAEAAAEFHRRFVCLKRMGFRAALCS